MMPKEIGYFPHLSHTTGFSSALRVEKQWKVTSFLAPLKITNFF